MSTATQPSATAEDYYLPVRPDWLDRRREAHSMPIRRSSIPTTTFGTGPVGAISWMNCGRHDEGHKIVATVFVQARAMFRASGPVEMRHVGETEFVNGAAAMSASGIYGKTRHCAGIVGHADLDPGRRVEPVLEAHLRAGGDRFRGIRHSSAWDEDAKVAQPGLIPSAGPARGNGLSRGLCRLRQARPQLRCLALSPANR